ncbi:MAG: SEC-C metal-binding domain-containing protein [Solirubrobacteraceae bacterium]
MTAPGRNQACPCGSGRKVKRCCGQQRGPSEEQLDRAFIAQRAGVAAAQLRDLSTDTLKRLWEELDELPGVDLSLVVSLPALQTPELDQLLKAARDDDLDTAEDVMPAVLTTIDTPRQRAQLARAVINLRDSGKLTSRQAAIAIIDLDSDSQLLIRASLINAIFIHAGLMHTPAGLRLAA